MLLSLHFYFEWYAENARLFSAEVYDHAQKLFRWHGAKDHLHSAEEFVYDRSEFSMRKGQEGARVLNHMNDHLRSHHVLWESLNLYTALEITRANQTGAIVMNLSSEHTSQMLAERWGYPDFDWTCEACERVYGWIRGGPDVRYYYYCYYYYYYYYY